MLSFGRPKPKPATKRPDIHKHCPYKGCGYAGNSTAEVNTHMKTCAVRLRK